MTDRKDFKRVVRARSRRTGESYSSALRNVRNAHLGRTAATEPVGRQQREPLMNITRAIPEVRSTNVDKTVRFYTELFGFDTRIEDGRVVALVSRSHSEVEVLLNRGALPPGFTIEVATDDDARELFERTPTADVRVVEPPSADRPDFSVLDPSGRRVTIAPRNRHAGTTGAPATDTDRQITRAIPGSIIDAAPAKAFYVDFLGLRIRNEWPGTVMFESATSPRAQVLAGTSLSSPDSFDLDVGSAARVDAIHAASVGNAVVMGPPEDFPTEGVRCFLLIDPNGVAINVVAHMERRQ